MTFGDFKRSRTYTSRRTRPVTAVCVWALVSWIFCESLPAQQRSLKTEDTDLLELGRIRLEFGVEFLQGQRYSLSGLEGDLTRVGVASLRFGVGEYADFEVSGVVQDFLSVSRRYPPVIAPDFAGNATSDVGDLILATRLRFAREGNRRPALGLKFAVQLPNASNEKRPGNGRNQFFLKRAALETRGASSVARQSGVGHTRLSRDARRSGRPAHVRPRLCHSGSPARGRLRGSSWPAGAGSSGE